MPHSSSSRIVYCHCAFAQVIPADVKQGLLERLVDSGVDFDCVPDLCEMSARRDPALSELVQLSNIRIAACYPRAVHGLFTAAGTPLPKTGVEIVNLRTLNADEAFAALTQDASSTAEESAS